MCMDAGMFIEMCLAIHFGICGDLCGAMCTDMRISICIDVCIDLCINMFTDMCIPIILSDVCTYARRHV